MLKGYDPLKKLQDNSKAGLTIRLNQKDDEAPFEATVFFRKSGRNPEELREKDAINLTASGKLRLDIGENGFIEVFVEKTGRLQEPDTEAVTEKTEEA
jgi:hypothetical protein